MEIEQVLTYSPPLPLLYTETNRETVSETNRTNIETKSELETKPQTTPEETQPQTKPEETQIDVETPIQSTPKEKRTRKPSKKNLSPIPQVSGRRQKQPKNWSKVLDEDGGGIYFEGDVLAIRASNDEPFWLAYLDEDCLDNKSQLEVTWFEIDNPKNWKYIQGGADTIEQGTILCKVRLVELDDGTGQWQLPLNEVKVIKDIIKDEAAEVRSSEESSEETMDSEDSSISSSGEEDTAPLSSIYEGSDFLSFAKEKKEKKEKKERKERSEKSAVPGEEKIKKPRGRPPKRKREDEPIVLKSKKRKDSSSKPEIPLRGTNFQCYLRGFPF